MKTNVLINSATLYKDCLFLVTGYGKKETEGMVFSDDVGKQGEWICFDKAVKIEVAEPEEIKELVLNPDKVVKLYHDGVFQGEFVPFYNPNEGIIKIMSVKTMVFGMEELRVAV